jgi:hypothetical protein
MREIACSVLLVPLVLAGCSTHRFYEGESRYPVFTDITDD